MTTSVWNVLKQQLHHRIVFLSAHFQQEVIFSMESFSRLWCRRGFSHGSIQPCFNLATYPEITITIIGQAWRDYACFRHMFLFSSYRSHLLKSLDVDGSVAALSITLCSNAESMSLLLVPVLLLLSFFLEINLDLLIHDTLFGGWLRFSHFIP